MDRLKLFGEPEGGSTNDHSTLSNLGYAQSGHTGFVPSQGEALIEILRLSQNTIRDSAGNNRITLSPTSPHVSLAGDLKVTGHIGAGTASPDLASILNVSKTNTSLASFYGLNLYVTQAYSAGAIGIGVNGIVENQCPSYGSYARGLAFTARHGAPSPIQGLQGVYMGLQTFNNSGEVAQVAGGYLFAQFGTNTPVAESRGMWIRNFGAPTVTDAYGLHIDNQSGASGINRILHCGGTVPNLRLDGGADPPADKSNLYLKFGSTLYRVVKTGTSMTLEAA
jgi:hypothetical protein